MNVLKRYRLEIIFSFILVLVYFSTRLYHLTSLPIFTDEAIYIRWAQIAKNDATWRFISLTDGKQPLFVWLTMVTLRIFRDPLFAGRIVSVFAGFFTTIGLFFLGKELFKNKWVGFLSGFLYILYPMGLVYDRMALYDSLVGTIMVWVLYFEILLVKKNRLDISLILGIILGAGLLTKSSAFFGIPFLIITLFLFDFSRKDRTRRIFNWIVLASAAAIFSYGYYSILRLSPFFHIINEKNSTFVYSFFEWLQYPFLNVFGNLKGLLGWFITYITWPIVLILIIPFFIKGFIREKIVLVLWFLVPFLYLAVFGKVIYPRFILFMTLSFLPLAAYAFFNLFVRIKNKSFAVFIFLICSFFALQSDHLILTDFSTAPIPASDLNQYILGWPAGGGVKEAIAFLNNESQKGKLFIGTEGTFGLMPYALEMYLVDNPNMVIKGFWPIQDNPPKELEQKIKKVPTYFLFYQPCPSCLQIGSAPKSWPLKEILRIKKSEGNYVTLYQLQFR